MSIPSDRACVDRADLNLLAVDEDASLVGLVEAAKDLDERRLACAVVADQAEHLALAEVHGDVDERRHDAEALGDVLDPDRVLTAVCGALSMLAAGCVLPSLPEVLSRAICTFATIAARIAIPMMM